MGEDDKELERLLHAARAGDRLALNHLLGRLHGWIRRRADRVVRARTPPIGASTLAQETALTLTRNIHKVHALTVPSVKALLRRIMVNTSETARRRAATLTRTPPPASGHGEGDDPSVGLLAQIDGERALALLPRLPPTQAEALRLALAGHDVTDIAALLGTSPATIYGRLARARAALAALLPKD